MHGWACDDWVSYRIFCLWVDENLVLGPGHTYIEFEGPEHTLVDFDNTLNVLRRKIVVFYCRPNFL